MIEVGISAINRPYPVGVNLQIGRDVYHDRSYTYTHVPSSVQGGSYIRTANNDKAQTGNPFLTLTIDQPSIVYVAHDVRISPKPSWLNAFADTGESLITSDTTLQLFKKTYPTGPVELGYNQDGSGSSMYAVVIQYDEPPINQEPRPKVVTVIHTIKESTMTPHELAQVPPIYTVAYISPTTPSQQGQEAAVAKYPLAIISSDDRAVYREWRDRVRELNPSIILLGYMQVARETVSQGPGHRHMLQFGQLADLQNGWVTQNVFAQGIYGVDNNVSTYPGRYNNPPQDIRLWDMRSTQWQDRFVEACSLVLADYPYDGLFLDNCTVFTGHDPDAQVRADMLAGLQEAILKLRGRFPRALFVGNGRYNIDGLNGEMNEGRPNDLDVEAAVYSGHVGPRMDMFLQSFADYEAERDAIETKAMEVTDNGIMFAAYKNAQTVSWFPVFDDILAKWRGRLPR